MTYDEAVRRLAAAGRFLDQFEETQATHASARNILSVLEELERIRPVIGGLQAYLKDGGKAPEPLRAVAQSVHESCRRLQPVLESGNQYCVARLAMVCAPREGYTANGTVSPSQRYGAISEEA